MLEIIVLLLVATLLAFALLRIPVRKVEISPNERFAASVVLVLLTGWFCAGLAG